MRWWLLIFIIDNSTAQKIITRGKTVTVTEGDELELSCYVQDLGDENIIWKKNKEPIFVDEDELINDDRFSVVKEGSNSTLTIINVEPIDMSEYTCEISEPQSEITYKVIVHNERSIGHMIESLSPVASSAEYTPPPTVVISPDESEYFVTAGEHNVIVRCHAKGNPTPSVTWTREVGKNGKVPSDVIVRNHQLIIPTAEKHHSGEYSCVANNTAGYDAVTIKIQVNDKEDASSSEEPWVKTEQSFFSEERFRNTAQFALRNNNHSKTILNVVGINEDSFGDYMCRVSNNLGSKFAVIHVSVDNHGDDKWEHSISLLPYLEAGLRYELTVKARNSLGWGSFAKNYVTIEIPASQKDKTSTSSTVLSLSEILAVILVALRFRVHLLECKSMLAFLRRYFFFRLLVQYHRSQSVPVHNSDSCCKRREWACAQKGIARKDFAVGLNRMGSQGNLFHHIMTPVHRTVCIDQCRI
uniref:Neurotrimin n=1 Tax=Heterorhabditis bacteriophora TaxID=37862 RepID=A0A1I7WNM6_HETBA